jgi:fatty-acid desaturase
MNHLTQWEQRDILSHSNYLVISSDEHLLISKIISNLIIGTDCAWDHAALSLNGEAYLQKSLRMRGYNLYCANLNILPHSTSELSQYIANYSQKLQISSTIESAKYRISDGVKYIYNSIIKFLFSIASSTRGVSSTVLIVALLLWFSDINYFIGALVVGYIFSNCMTLVFHEHWVHRQLSPKNRIVGFIFDYLCHLIVHDRIFWIYSHTYHHRHWKTTQDIEVNAMLAGSWLYYFIFASPVHGNLTHRAGADASCAEVMSQLNPESQFLQKYVTEITLATHLIFLLIFGLSVYTYFLLFQIWIFHKYIVVFDELVTHYNNKTRDEEVDNPYLFLICCGTAYHKSHHTLFNSIILGPGKLKYMNIQYYFIKLFYNITAKVPATYITEKENHV